MSNETMKDGERAAFEAWWLRDVPEAHRDFAKKLLDGYGQDYAAAPGVVDAWTAWQAGAEFSAKARTASPQSGEKEAYERGWDDGHIAGREKTRAAAPQAALDEIVYAVQAYGDARADGGNSAEAIGKVGNLLRALTQAPTEHTSDGLFKLIEEAANCIAEAVTYEQDGFDSPPQPATQWDYNAEQLAYALRGEVAARKTEIERMSDADDFAGSYAARRASEDIGKKADVLKATLRKAEIERGE
ncbi:hypothetical protein [Paraburkholderia unamae]|uniref:Uncharacterized protein n=1 Tax=Paraburkholderia unamae TaxID=219649 RepID=A0ABX5KAU9_9BURK|nr:hypothetical protein [Paraburkholderia unamae]PVX61290.1 hypothetical protein C7402_1412 [Paraburkholderia unamae]